MKQSVNPVVAGVVIAVVLVVVVGLFVWQGKRSGAGSAGQQPPGMPADVQKEFQERMRRAGQPGGTTAPSGGGRLGMPPPGVPVSPPGQGR
jgi:hypothetical protein